MASLQELTASFRNQNPTKRVRSYRRPSGFTKDFEVFVRDEWRRGQGGGWTYKPNSVFNPITGNFVARRTGNTAAARRQASWSKWNIEGTLRVTYTAANRPGTTYTKQYALGGEYTGTAPRRRIEEELAARLAQLNEEYPEQENGLRISTYSLVNYSQALQAEPGPYMMNNELMYGLGDGETRPKWGKPYGCVINALNDQYGNLKGMKAKSTKVALFNHFKGTHHRTWEDVEAHAPTEPSLLREYYGVTPYQVRDWCAHNGMACYTLDINGNCWRAMPPLYATSTNSTALVYVVHSGHMYVIHDKQRKTCITRRYNGAKNKKVLKVELDEKKVEDAKQRNVRIIEATSPVDGVQKIVREIQRKNMFPHKTTVDSSEHITSAEFGDETIQLNYNKQEILDQLKQLSKEVCPFQTLFSLIHNQVMKKVSQLASYTQPDVMDLLTQRKGYPHLGLTPPWEHATEFPEETTRADINKAYTHALVNLQHLYVADGDSTIEVFDLMPKDRRLAPGLYLITTDDRTLLNDCGVYTAEITQQALDEGLIYPDDITHWIRCKTRPNIFPKLIADLQQVCGGPKTALSKLAVNSITGLLGRSKKKMCALNFSRSADDYVDYVDKHSNVANVKCKKYATNSINEDDDTPDVLAYGHSTEYPMLTNHFPIYLQIVQANMINLHNHIKKVGPSSVIFRKIDCFITTGQVETSPEPGGLSIEVDKRRVEEECRRHPPRDMVLPTPTKKQWTNHLVVSDEPNIPDIIFDILERDQVVLITGRAGTGKTTIANQLQHKYKKVLRTALTNVAALLVDGITLYKALFPTTAIEEAYAPDFAVLEKLKLKYDFLMVDEAGMADMRYWVALSHLKRHGIKIALFGDFRQLGPVEDGSVNYQNHPLVISLCNGNHIELTKIWRYDQALLDVSENVLNKRPKEYDAEKDGCILRHICWTNECVAHTNKKVHNLIEPQREHRLDIAPHNYDKYDVKLVRLFRQAPWSVWVGQPLFAHTACKKYGLLKNQMYFVEKISQKDKTFIIEGNDRVWKDCEFWTTFVPGYAMTCHKSQGTTMTDRYVIHEWDFVLKANKDASKWLYTALTRATSLDQVRYTRRF